MTKNEKQNFLRTKRKLYAVEKAKRLLRRLDVSENELELQSKELMKTLDDFKIDELSLETKETDEEELIRSKLLARDLHDIAMENHLFNLIHQSLISELAKTELGDLAHILFLIHKNINSEKFMILSRLTEIQNYYLHEKESKDNSKTNIELRKIAEGFKNLHGKKDMKYVLHGREGGKKIKYSNYYNVSKEIIINYNGDLAERGIISRLVRLTDKEILKTMDDNKEEDGIPSDRQCRTIIRKHLEELK